MRVRLIMLPRLTASRCRGGGRASGRARENAMKLRMTLACVALGAVTGCCGPRADCHVVHISSPPTGLESEGRTYLAPPRPLGCNHPCGLVVSSTRNGSDLSLLIEGARLERNGANRSETFAISLEVPVV